MLKYSKLVETDEREVIDLLLKYLPIDIHRLMLQIEFKEIDYEKSIKCCDDNKIIGVLILSDKHLTDNLPIKLTTPNLYNSFENKKMLKGFAFVIEKEFRNKGVNKKMIENIQPFLVGYDYIWCGVQSPLKSAKYWQRMGFKHLFSLLNINILIYDLKNLIPH